MKLVTKTLVLLVALVVTTPMIAPTASAQCGSTSVCGAIGLQFHPLVGYYFDESWGGPVVGLGATAQVLNAITYTVGVRPTVEAVFVSSDPTVSWELYRVNADLIAGLSLPTLPVTPYAKAGATYNISRRKPDVGDSSTDTAIAPSFGAGVSVSNISVEGTYRTGDYKGFTLTALYNFSL